MLRFAGAIIIIFASYAIGRSFAGQLDRRCRILNDIERCLLALAREISYTKTPLPQALIIASRAGGEGGVIFRLAGEKLLKGQGVSAQEAWEESLMSLTIELGLKNTDLDVLTAFGAGLGLSHAEDQLKRIEICRERLYKLEEEAKAYGQKFGKVWKNLGWMAGLAIALIFF